MSHKGEALDEKTLHLRSVDAINCEGGRLFRPLSDTESHEMVSNDPDQSFLLSNREPNVKRPVLIVRGRTVVRAPPLKGQDECLNYFGTLAPKVKAILVYFHTEMWKLGMSTAVVHNEVAPKQHEISNIFALSNVSADQHSL